MLNKILLLAALTGTAPARAQSSCDVLIRNGKIINGTGNNWFYGDIAVDKGKIRAIGKNLPYTGATEISASGLVVAPGFIDVHTHIEGDEDKDPLAHSFIYDGVTTVVAGNCGSSNLNIGRYFHWLDSLKLSINVATLIGHNDVRRAVMGRANRPPAPGEQAQMEALVERAMKEGAVGLSTGLIYIPGTYSKSDEIIALAKVAAKYNGVYATHMRSEGNNVAEAIRETLQIGREAHIPVEISHFKLSGQQNWGRSKETVALVEQARKEGIDVTIDQYPYTASSTSISTLLPSEVLADGQDSIRARLQRPDVVKYVVNDMLKSLKQRKLKHFSYAVVAYYKPDTSYNGKSIEEINLMKGRRHKAREEALTVIDIMMNGGASAVFHGMSEEDVKYIMKYPYNTFASDASIRIMNEGMPHPRGYGTNARVLAKYVRNEKVLSLEEAIRRMTSLPAQKFNLSGRGLLKEGMAADIVIFDPEKVQDLATFEKPHAYSKGFEYVLVNGQVTVSKELHTGIRAGKALRNAPEF
ncbi:N-acyl-D-amino-acid deacylase family protein [Niabella beijingensis]|uniref:N-acyl-D-amino-acid deacylase family protein n=1 Tax=Niabella beijingensis TaxID=2872700 RepID=UPI001CC0670E|nr:D-aminoacylase [Niabella beijingensis]MBZ4189072.1 D-aminoacylase [Niabella beijingensis]